MTSPLEQTPNQGQQEVSPRILQLRRVLDGHLSQHDLSAEDVIAIGSELITTWPVSRGLLDQWTQIASPRVIGPILSRTASNLELRVTHEELLYRVCEHATPEEAARIVLRAAPHLQDVGRSILERAPDATYHVLVGRRFSLQDRVFGVSFEDFFFGARGLVGPPGVVGVGAAIGFYTLVQPIPLPTFVAIWIVVFGVSRALVLRNTPPRLVPDTFMADPETRIMAQSVGFWVARECAMRRRAPEAWSQIGFVSETSPVAETTEELPVLTLFKHREFGTPAERLFAHEELIRLANSQNTEVAVLIEESLRDLDVDDGPPEFYVEAWLFRTLALNRHWTPSEFASLFLNAAMVSITRRVLWGVYDGYSELKQIFRVDESAERVDLHDRPVKLGPYMHIKVLPVTDIQDLEAWSEVFADYAIVELLSQLELGQRLKSAQKSTQRTLQGVELMQVSGVDVSSCDLSSCGYLPCPEEDSGEVFQYRKPLTELGITVYMEVEEGIIDSMVVVPGLHFEPSEVIGRPSPMPSSLVEAEFLQLLRSGAT